jgi:hypothetical protein
MVLASGLQEIEKGIQAGVVSLHTFENARNQQQAIDFIADCIALASGSPLLQDRRSIMEVRTAPLLQEFVQGMISAVSDGSSLPLFDDKTSHLINAGVRAGVIIPSNSATTQAKHSALAADLLERIPRFEEASIDQVLEIRNALDTP